MNLQGKDLVSTATQKSARALVATSLAVLLAKVYAVPLHDLSILGVSIPLQAVRGAVVVVLGFQLVNHIIHWWGDLRSNQSWNAPDKVNGIGRIGAGSHILTKLEAALEKLDTFSEERQIRKQSLTEETTQAFLADLARCRAALEAMSASVTSFRSFAAFYFIGWFFALPVCAGLAALFWPSNSL